jgi:hypothetical protein
LGGNLTVNGNITYINSNVITTNEKSITLANNQSTAANVDGSGIDIGNATVAYWRFNNATSSWQSNIGLTPAANATLNLGGTSNYWAGAYLTSATVSGNVTGGNINTAGLVTATGNITGGNINTAGLITATGNITGGNVLTAGLVSATGNVTGGNVRTAGTVLVQSATAIPAGGTTGAGYTVSSTANFGVFFGSGVPTLSAAKGSLYLRSDGSTTNDRMYVNTNGTTGWTAVITAT